MIKGLREKTKPTLLYVTSKYLLLQAWVAYENPNGKLYVTPKYLLLETTKLSTDGVGTFISNADFIYNSTINRLYMVCDKRPFADGKLSIVADTSCEYYTDINLDMSSLSYCKWNLMKDIDSSITGHSRNHNCGFIRNEKGYISETPVILCTVADTSLWEYKIMKIK